MERLRNKRRAVRDQSQMGLAERVERLEPRTEGVRLENEDAAWFRPGRCGRAGGCNPKPVVDEGQAKFRVRFGARRVRWKLREVNRLAGGAGLAGRIDEADRRVIGVAPKEGPGKLRARAGAEEGGGRGLIGEGAPDGVEPGAHDLGAPVRGRRLDLADVALLRCVARVRDQDDTGRHGNDDEQHHPEQPRSHRLHGADARTLRS